MQHPLCIHCRKKRMCPWTVLVCTVSYLFHSPSSKWYSVISNNNCIPLISSQVNCLSKYLMQFLRARKKPPAICEHDDQLMKCVGSL